MECNARECRESNMTDANESVAIALGYEDAMIGCIERRGQPLIAVYDTEKCISILVDRDGMAEDEAREFFSLNTLGAWFGERSPAFLERRPGVRIEWDGSDSR